MFRIRPGAASIGLGYGQADEVPGARVGRTSRRLGRIRALIGADREASVTWHGIAGIHTQIYEHLFDHPRIRMNQRQVVAGRKLESDILPNEAAEHFFDATENLVQV